MVVALRGVVVVFLFNAIAQFTDALCLVAVIVTFPVLLRVLFCGPRQRFYRVEKKEKVHATENRVGKAIP